jgi:hypothetical protein
MPLCGVTSLMPIIFATVELTMNVVCHAFIICVNDEVMSIVNGL